MQERNRQAEGVRGRETALRDTAGTAASENTCAHPQSIERPEGTLMYAADDGTRASKDVSLVPSCLVQVVAREEAGCAVRRAAGRHGKSL